MHRVLAMICGCACIVATGCGDRAEDTCAKVYDECGLRWSVPDKTFSREECVSQLERHSEGEDAERTEQLHDCVEDASCETVLACFG